MIGRQWLADVGLAVLLVLPTAGLMWPSPSATAQPTDPQSRQVTGVPITHSPIEQRFGIKR